MKKRKLLNRVVGFGLVVSLASLPLLSGCTAMASKEQLTMLEEARKAADAAEADLKACRQKSADLEREITQKKQTLAEWQDALETVKEGLKTFGQDMK